MMDPAIIWNRVKIEAAVRSARALRAIQEKFGSFDTLLLAIRRWTAETQPVEDNAGDSGYLR